MRKTIRTWENRALAFTLCVGMVMESVQGIVPAYVVYASETNGIEFSDGALTDSSMDDENTQEDFGGGF